MICSEYIYTSWKNGGMGSGFTTFAKSDSVTTEEWTEIVDRMTYVKPVDLPDRPSPEEIDSYFPRNSAYFRLKSGRYCMAQSSYVGEDYAVDVNARWANYIIHAFLFDTPDGTLAASYLDSALYKRGLTEEEREYSGVVAPEPVELDALDPAEYAEDALMEIIEQGEEDEFFIFIQGIIDRIGTNANLIVGIKNRDKINRFVRAMSLVLPRPFLDSTTFGTYLLYKETAYTVNFLYNFETYDIRSELSAYPGNGIMFFDSGEIYGASPLCRYLLEYRDCLRRNRMSAFRLKDDMDSVYASDGTLSLDGALDVKHYIKRNVEYFKDFAQFESLTVYILGQKAYPRASETAMYMIQNSAFDEEDKRTLFYIGDVFLQLEENEQGAVREEFFKECFMNSEAAAEFVEKYEANTMVTGEYTPLTYEFFRQFTDQGDDLREKAVRFVIELEEIKYSAFDNSLKTHYFKIAELYFGLMLGRGDFASAERCIYALKAREDSHRAGMACYIIQDIVESDFNGWYDTAFDFSMMELVADDRQVYWQLFNRIINSLQATPDVYWEFIDSYARKRLQNDMDFDSDISEYAHKFGFVEHLDGLNYSIFLSNDSKTVHDFINTYNSLFGYECPYEGYTEERNRFYDELSVYLDFVKNDGSKSKKDNTGGLYMWASEISVLVSMIDAERANYDLLEWIVYELERNVPLDKFVDVSDVMTRLLFIREWICHREDVLRYPELLLYLDMISVSSANNRRNCPPYYVNHIDDIFGRMPEKKIVPFIRGIIPSMFRDGSLSKKECNYYISPLLVYKKYRYLGEVYDSIVNAFDYAAENGNIEPFAWLVDYYIESLTLRSKAEEVEEKLIFRVLAKHRKAIVAMAETSGRAYPEIPAYLDGLTFNVFGKAKRVEPMRLRR